MRISVGGDYDIVLSEVFCGVGIETDQGTFGVAQRDGGLEIMLNGRLIWSSTSSQAPQRSLGGMLDRAVLSQIAELREELKRADENLDLVRRDRDSARAIARVLAHSYHTDSSPPRGMVREALDFPVKSS